MLATKYGQSECILQSDLKQLVYNDEVVRRKSTAASALTATVVVSHQMDSEPNGTDYVTDYWLQFPFSLSPFLYFFRVELFSFENKMQTEMYSPL